PTRPEKELEGRDFPEEGNRFGHEDIKNRAGDEHRGKREEEEAPLDAELRHALAHSRLSDESHARAARRRGLWVRGGDFRIRHHREFASTSRLNRNCPMPSAIGRSITESLPRLPDPSTVPPSCRRR